MLIDNVIKNIPILYLTLKLVHTCDLSVICLFVCLFAEKIVHVCVLCGGSCHKNTFFMKEVL